MMMMMNNDQAKHGKLKTKTCFHSFNTVDWTAATGKHLATKPTA